MLTLVTPTRHRPHAWPLCERRVLAQTLRPDLWVVATDADDETFDSYRFTMGQEVARSTPREGLHSVCANYLAGLGRVPDGSAVVCWEDDDWYHPAYLETVAGLLRDADLAGVAPALYYHAGTRAWLRHWNAGWASLAATAFGPRVRPLFRASCERGDPFIDQDVWRRWQGRKVLVPNAAADGRALQVGIKDGTGVGLGHRLAGPADAGGSVLRGWLGEDAADY